jgi:hypothetical protein
MRRAVAVVVSLLWCGLLLGCAAITDPASHVGATGATLNAHGQTESSPATYFFQYALTESGLGTAAAQRTPTRGPIPANVPGNGGFVSFGESIGGLAPNTTYYFEVCGRDAKLSSDVCGGVRSLTTAAPSTEDTVGGNWHLGPVTHGFDDNGSVSAVSDSGGQHPSGSLTWSSEEQPAPSGGIFSGNVTCLLVSGNRATVGAVGTLTPLSGGSAGPGTFLLSVIDNGPYPQAPQFEQDVTGQVEAAGTTPPDCSAGPGASDQPLPASIIVHQGS